MVFTHGEGDVTQGNTVTGSFCLGRPVLVDIEAVGSIVRKEAIEDDVFNIAISAPRFDHKDLIAAICVDIAVENILDGRPRPEGADGASTGLVAPNPFDKDVVRRRFNSDTLVSVCDLDIMDPVV